MEKTDSDIPVHDAVSTIAHAMAEDSDYAWTWHCNIARCAQDEGMDHAASNRVAARFMKLAFDAEGYESNMGAGDVSKLQPLRRNDPGPDPDTAIQNEQRIAELERQVDRLIEKRGDADMIGCALREQLVALTAAAQAVADRYGEPYKEQEDIQEKIDDLASELKRQRKESQ